MLIALFGAIASAPIFWFLVPVRARKDFLAIASLIALGFYDVRLPVLACVLVLLLYAAGRGIGASNRARGRVIMVLGFAVLLALFAANKLMSGGAMETALASQTGIVLLGMSYFVLKAASILIETGRRTLAPPGLLALARWLIFFPIYPSGPIEGFKHFDDQEPVVDRARILLGFERILFGCVRALLLSHLLAEWTAPVLADPSGYSLPVLILVVYGVSLRIYFDFAGYSDIAIGLSALYGYEIQENFDRPLIQRNIVALWQRWHMTLTGWLRIYLFTPWTRKVMMRGRRWHMPAIVSGQIVTMLFCGLWHDLSWGFALWGTLHGVALVLAGVVARDVGRRLPAPWVNWWRRDPIAYGLSTFLTLTTFSAINIFAVTDLPTAFAYFAQLFGVA